MRSVLSVRTSILICGTAKIFSSPIIADFEFEGIFLP